jgi:serine/threonine protein kinase
MTMTWTTFAVNIVRELGSSLSDGGLTGPERVHTLIALIRGIPLIYLLSELASRPFEKYLKSDILVDYRELTGDDTNDLSNLLRHMLVLDPKQRSTVHEILGHKWFNST